MLKVSLDRVVVIVLYAHQHSVSIAPEVSIVKCIPSHIRYLLAPVGVEPKDISCPLRTPAACVWCTRIHRSTAHLPSRPQVARYNEDVAQYNHEFTQCNRKSAQCNPKFTWCNQDVAQYNYEFARCNRKFTQCNPKYTRCNQEFAQEKHCNFFYIEQSRTEQ